MAGGGFGGLAQGIATGVRQGTAMWQNERRLDLEEKAQGALALDRALKAVDALDAQPDRAPQIMALAKKYGVDIPEDGATPGVKPEQAFLKLQQGETLGQDDLTALTHAMRRDKTGAFRTSVADALKKMTSDKELSATIQQISTHQAENPGGSYEDSAAAVARTSPQANRSYKALKETYRPELNPEQKLIEQNRTAAASIIGMAERGSIAPDKAVQELLALPGGAGEQYIKNSPALAAIMEKKKTAAGVVGKAQGLMTPFNLADVEAGPAAPAAPAPAPEGVPYRPRSLEMPGASETPLLTGDLRGMLQNAGVQNLGDIVSPTPAAPARMTTPLAVAGQEAEAKVTSVQKRGAASQERNAASQESQAASSERRAATGEGQLALNQQKAQDVKERLSATLKTMEALTIQAAKEAFPNDAAKQLALATRLKNSLTGFQAMIAGDATAADIDKKIQDEVARLRGELVDSTPKGPARAAVQKWLGGLWSGMTDYGDGQPAAPAAEAPKPRPGPVARPQAAPKAAAAPADPAALKAARDGVAQALYPGRAWAELAPEEKQAVAARLGGGGR